MVCFGYLWVIILGFDVVKKVTLCELMKEMGKKWSSLASDQKVMFTKAAEKDKKRYFLT